MNTFIALIQLKASPLILVLLGGAIGVLRWLTGV